MKHAERTFYDFLRLCLDNNQLTQKSLITWIEGQQIGDSAKSTSAIKEQLRQASIRKLDAWQFPFIHEIARFFEWHGYPDSACRIRHIYLQQSFDLGVIDDIFAPADTDLDQIWWLIFPPPCIGLCDKEVRDWRQRCAAGDFALYRYTLGLYKQFAFSAVHAPVRKYISIDVARTAISNADYAEAYMIAQHVVRSWRQSWRGEGQDAKAVDSLDADLYLRALRIIAIAKSNMFPVRAYEESKDAFDTAAREMDACLEAGLISAESAQRHRRTWSYRYLRMLTRLPFVGDFGHMDEMSSTIAEINEFLRVDEELDRDRVAPERPSGAYDTVARAYALMSMVRAPACLEMERTAGKSCLALAKEANKEAKKLRYLEELRTQSGVLGTIRDCSTEIIILCAEQIEEPSGLEARKDRIWAYIEELSKVIGPSDLRHTQITLTFLTRFVDRVFKEKTKFEPGWLKGTARAHLEEAFMKKHRLELDRQWDRSEELLFPPARRTFRLEPIDKWQSLKAYERDEMEWHRNRQREQRLSLEHANRLFAPYGRQLRRSRKRP